MEEGFAQILAGLICLGMWAVIAFGAAALGHWRMTRVEAALRRRAEPMPERVQLLYAGATVVWLSAAVLALVALAKRDWARTGRNCLFIFLGHITVATVLVVALLPPQAPPDEVAWAMIVIACSIAALSFLSAATFASRWSFLRAARIAAEPANKHDDLDLVLRYFIYLGSLLLWPVGLVSVLMLNKPGNVRVGATSFTLSLVNVVAIALVTCIGLPLLVALLG